MQTPITEYITPGPSDRYEWVVQEAIELADASAIVHSPLLQTDDILQRLKAIAALDGPWARYHHHDGSVWDGYGELDDEQSSATASEFWYRLMGTYSYWVYDQIYDFGHGYDPISGRALHENSDRATENICEAVDQILQRVADRERYLESQCLPEPCYDDIYPSRGDTIEEMFADGADVDELIEQGYLRDDDAPRPVKLAKPEWSVWAYNQQISPEEAAANDPAWSAKEIAAGQNPKAF